MATLDSQSPGVPASLVSWRQPTIAGVLTGLAIAVTAALGIGVFYAAIRDALLDDVRSHLGTTAETAAALIPGDRLRSFTDSAQTKNPEYLALSEPLAALLRVNPDIRFAYAGIVKGDSAFYLLDGDRSSEGAYVMQPDQPTEGELTIARTGQTVVEQRPSPTVWGLGIRAYAPIAGYPGAYIGVTLNPRRYDAAVSRMSKAAVLGFSVALVLAILGGLRAGRVERGQRLAAAEIFEARRLAGTAAEERLALEHLLHNRQKMEALGTLAGGVAHDFNNLLMVILGQAEMIADGAAADSQAASSAAAIRNASVRARELVRQILLFARPEAEAQTVTALAPVIAETVALLRATLPSSNRIVWDPPADSITAVADRSKLSQVLMNLGLNASHAFPNDRGTLTFTLDEVQLGATDRPRLGLEPGSYARIVVRDDGSGMTGEVRSRIFEPFYTTKPAGKGSGLGLAVADGVVRGHHGAIEVESEIGAGAAFSIYLPAAGVVAPDPSASTAVLPKAKAGAGQRVLLLDDDEGVLGILTRILGRAGYQVSPHADPHAALVELEAEAGAFDLLITDRTMPGLSGPEVAQRARMLNPNLPILLLTGADQPADLESSWFSAIVGKPVDRAGLLLTIDRVLGQRPVS